MRARRRTGRTRVDPPAGARFAVHSRISPRRQNRTVRMESVVRTPRGLRSTIGDPVAEPAPWRQLCRAPPAGTTGCRRPDVQIGAADPAYRTDSSPSPAAEPARHSHISRWPAPSRVLTRASPTHLISTLISDRRAADRSPARATAARCVSTVDRGPSRSTGSRLESSRSRPGCRSPHLENVSRCSVDRRRYGVDTDQDDPRRVHPAAKRRDRVAASRRAAHRRSAAGLGGARSTVSTT